MSVLLFMILRSLGFAAGLLLSLLIFGYLCLEKKEKWGLKYLGSSILTLGAAALLGFVYSQIMSNGGYGYGLPFQVIAALVEYTLIYALAVPVVLFCFKGSVMEKLSVLLFAGAMRHFCFSIYTAICYLLPAKLRFYTYNPSFDIGSLFIYLGIFMLLYLLAFLVAFRYKDSMTSYKNRSTLILFFVMLFYAIIVNAISEVYSEDYRVLFPLLFITQMGICVFLFASQILSYKHEQSEQEKRIIEALLKEKRDQYEVSKASIEQLNIKLHDLKHYKSQLDIQTKEIEELSSIYESFVHTGNEVVDTVINEKSLLCRKKEIEFTCLADGEAVGFLEPAETYSLLGNILDNAMEAVEKVEEKHKRFISMTIRKTKTGALIECDNYFQETPIEVDGKLKSSKKDSSSHGYGMRSIEYIAEKYGGASSFQSKGNIFHISISINA